MKRVCFVFGLAVILRSGSAQPVFGGGLALLGGQTRQDGLSASETSTNNGGTTSNTRNTQLPLRGAGFSLASLRRQATSQTDGSTPQDASSSGGAALNALVQDLPIVGSGFSGLGGRQSAASSNQHSPSSGLNQRMVNAGLTREQSSRTNFNSGASRQSQNSGQPAVGPRFSSQPSVQRNPPSDNVVPVPNRPPHRGPTLPTVSRSSNRETSNNANGSPNQLAANAQRPAIGSGLSALRRQPSPQSRPASPADVASQNGMTSPPQGFCSRLETRALFTQCLRTFGMRNQRLFSYLRQNGPVCRTEVFDCRLVDSLMTCINSQPMNIISNRCWPQIPQLLTQTWRRYGVPCTYDDIDKKCQNVSKELISTADRTQLWLGVDRTRGRNNQHDVNANENSQAAMNSHAAVQQNMNTNSNVRPNMPAFNRDVQTMSGFNTNGPQMTNFRRNVLPNRNVQARMNLNRNIPQNNGLNRNGQPVMNVYRNVQPTTNYNRYVQQNTVSNVSVRPNMVYNRNVQQRAYFNGNVRSNMAVARNIPVNVNYNGNARMNTNSLGNFQSARNTQPTTTVNANVGPTMNMSSIPRNVNSVGNTQRNVSTRVNAQQNTNTKFINKNQQATNGGTVQTNRSSGVQVNTDALRNLLSSLDLGGILNTPSSPNSGGAVQSQTNSADGQSRTNQQPSGASDSGPRMFG